MLRTILIRSLISKNLCMVVGFIICCLQLPECCRAFVSPTHPNVWTRTAKPSEQEHALAMGIQRHEHCHKRSSNTAKSLIEGSNRRTFFKELASNSLKFGAICGTMIGTQQVQPAKAVMENRQEVFKVGKELTIPEAKERFKDGQKSLDYLIEHYDEIIEQGGGDNVRRYIGTVGTTSGLYGIQKVMKILQEEADDIVEYTETMNEINAAINGVDGSAYMAIFVTTSTSYTPPAKYFGEGLVEAKRAAKAMKDLAALLHI